MRASATVIAWSVLLITACSDPSSSVDKNVVRPVKLYSVTAQKNIETVTLPAVVEASEQSILRFQIGGLLSDLNVIEGDEVEAGKILAKLDQREHLNTQQSALAAYDRASVEYDRAKALIPDKVISQSMYDARKADRDAADAALKNARKRVDDSVLRAPFRGVVAQIHVDQFEAVNAMEPVLTLQSDGTNDAVVQVPASVVIDYEKMELLDALLQLDAAPENHLPATLKETATLADPRTQTFEVRFAFSSPEQLLVLPGMTGRLRIRFRPKAPGSQTILTVPIAAIVRRTGEPFVWVLNPEEMSVSKRPVSIDTGPEGYVSVQQGLSEGELIVSAGGHYLMDGSIVREYAE